MSASPGAHRRTALRVAPLLVVAALLLAGTVTLERVRVTRSQGIRAALLATFTRLRAFEQRVDTLLTEEVRALSAPDTSTPSVPVPSATTRARAQVRGALIEEHAALQATARVMADSIVTRNAGDLGRFDSLLVALEQAAPAEPLATRLARLDALRAQATLLTDNARSRSSAAALAGVGRTDRVAWTAMGFAFGTLVLVGMAVVMLGRETRARLAAEAASDARAEHIRQQADELEARNAELARRSDELATAESHYKLIATGIVDVVSLTDLKGRLEWVSPSATAWLGWEPEELLGRTAISLVHAEDAAAIDPAALAHALATTGTYPPMQARVQRRDGSYVWTETTFTPRRDATGATIGFLRVTRDVTERRQIEARLSQAERLQAVGTLAGGLAHDFNNVLAVVRGTAEQLQHDASRGRLSDARVYGDLATILTATDRACSLTRQMLTFARRQVRMPVVRAIDEVLQANLPLLQHLVRCPEQIVLRAGAPGAYVQVDADEFGTAVMNLVANARDAMTDSGTVTIETDVATLPGDARDTVGLAPGAYVRVRVTDTGHGMPEAVLERAFEPFFTTKAVGEGTGLGLATVHGVLKALGGAVTIASREQVGTTVTLWLPMAVPAEPLESGTDTTAEDTPGARALRLLVVDDEVALRTMLVRLAQRWGHEVVSVGTAEEALALLDGDAFDVLITDFAMPGMTGRDLIELVRRTHPTMPTVMMSGYTQDPDTRAWLASGGSTFLEKPFTLAALGAVLRGAEPASA